MSHKSLHRAGLLAALLFIFAAGQLRAELPPDAQAAMKKGIIAAKEQEWKIAIESFQEARKNAPNAPEIYYNLGLAESKIPGRELRAIAWFGAYLAATTNTPNTPAVNDFIAGLKIKNQGNLSRLIQSVQDAASKMAAGRNPSHDFYGSTSNVFSMGSHSSDDSNNFHSVAKLYAMNGEIPTALKWAKNKDLKWDFKTISDIAETQAKAGDIIGAQTTVDLIKDGEDDINKGYAQSVIAKFQVEAGDIAGAQKTAELIQQYPNAKGWAQGYIIEAQTKAAKAQVAINDIADALKSAEQIQNVETKSEIRQAIAETQVNAGDIAGAQKTAGLLQDSGADKLWKSIVQNAIAEAQAKAGDMTNALTTADLIQDAGWKGRTQLDIAEAQAKAGDIAGAQKTAELLKDADPNKFWKSMARQAIAEAQANAGDITGALKTAGLLQDTGSNQPWKSTVQNTIAVAQAKLGDVASALKTVDLIQDAHYKNVALKNISEAQANSGDIAGALKTADFIQGARDKSYALYGIAKYQANTNNISGALKTSNLIKDAGNKSYAQMDIAEAQAKAGDIEGAKKTFAEALKTADLIQDVNDKNTVLWHVADDQTKTGDITGALKTADFIQDSFLKSCLQTWIAEAQAKAGDIPGSKLTFAVALRTANLITTGVLGSDYKGMAQERVADAQAKAGDFAGALKTADIIQNEYARRTKQNDILKAQGQALVQPAVLDWFSKLDDENQTDDCPLNTDPFLDMATYLKSLPSSDDPQIYFNALLGVGYKVARAQNVINQMLKQQPKS